MSTAVGIARRVIGSLVFRAVVTAALLWLVLSKLDWDTIGDRISSGNPGYGLLAILCIVAALAIGGLRWDALLRAGQVELPPREIFRIYAVTSFANAFLPTSVGGDVARPLMVSRRGPRLVRAIATVLIERLAALVALIVLAWIGTALEPAVVSTGALTALAVVSGGMVAAAALVALRPSLPRTLAKAAIPARFSAHLGEAAAVFSATARSPRTLGLVLIQSVAFQALVTIQLVLIGRMIGVTLSFGLAAVALALVTLATLLPISIGGFGVREGSYVVILGGGGIDHTDAVLISLLTVVVLFFATLPGAIELIRRGFSPAEGPGVPATGDALRSRADAGSPPPPSEVTS